MSETIAAIATARGPAGIGVIRVSGPGCGAIAAGITQRTLAPRRATLCRFFAAEGHALDQGLALFFSAPASFTGEDMLELHAHGGELVLELVLERVCSLGARHARPGEFSERAFHNGKIDLVQAEAISDLIASTSRQAARGALRSLQGRFSAAVQDLGRRLMQARACCEAGLDFADETDAADVDALLPGQLDDCLQRLDALLARAREGRRWQGCAQLVIAGPVNAGKSTLFNALCQEERAIVSARPGTTRDVINCPVRLGGVAIEIADTAGLRAAPDAPDALGAPAASGIPAASNAPAASDVPDASGAPAAPDAPDTSGAPAAPDVSDAPDTIEREGMRRTGQMAGQADLVLWLSEGEAPASVPDAWHAPVLLVRNKIDRSGYPAGRGRDARGRPEIAVSARTGQGLAQLTEAILEALGRTGSGEDMLLARQRHIQALQSCRAGLREAGALLARRGDPALAAEQLRLAQGALDCITGATVPDDVLGEIFSRFCIGK